MPQRPVYELFAGREGSTFTVVATGIPGALDQAFGPVELELTEVMDLSTDTISGFSLLFRGARDQEFGQERAHFFPFCSPRLRGLPP